MDGAGKENAIVGTNKPNMKLSGSAFSCVGSIHTFSALGFVAVGDVNRCSARKAGVIAAKPMFCITSPNVVILRRYEPFIS